MGKIQKAVRRADTTEDHVHVLPDGSETGGMLAKPSKDGSQMHSHLYECNEDTCETEPMHNYAGHTHKLQDGEDTKGPKAPFKKPGQPWKEEPKMDSLSREGSDWVVRSTTGNVIGRSENKSELKKQYPEAQEY